MAAAGPICENCGYDLAGLVDLGEEPTRLCPECGWDFFAHERFIPAPMPPLIRIVARMCWPTAALMLFIALVLRLGGPVAMFLAIMWPALLIGGGMVVLWVPADVASRIGKRSVIRPRRRMVAWSLAMTGVAVNLGLLVLMMVLLAAAM